MANKTKQTVHIRVRDIDKQAWKDYCSTLGKTSPELFNKILTSEKLNLNKRVLEELQKKEEALRRRAGF